MHVQLCLWAKGGSELLCKAKGTMNDVDIQARNNLSKLHDTCNKTATAVQHMTPAVCTAIATQTIGVTGL
jgi:hypothetical protein